MKPPNPARTTQSDHAPNHWKMRRSPIHATGGRFGRTSAKVTVSLALPVLSHATAWTPNNQRLPPKNPPGQTAIRATPAHSARNFECLYSGDVIGSRFVRGGGSG